VKITIAAVGRWRGEPMRALYEEYAGRLQWPLTLREVEVRRRLEGVALKREEALLLRAAIPAGALVVALDERGQALSSTGFAERIGGWRDSGVADLAFLIGGADGLDPELRDFARARLCFGIMTWPHLLIRGMLAEQLYRAQQILAGHPYHRA
jgi:23S rRNA (pseudouridine1915-N3)-methyltransferase